MRETWRNIGHTVIQLIIFLAILSIVVFSTMYNGKSIFAHIGETASAKVSEDGFTTSGSYVDTDTSKSLAGTSATITLKQQPTKEVSYTYTDVISVVEGSTEIPYSIISVTDNATGKDAIAEGLVSLDKTSKQITFHKKGIYQFKIRANGTSITRKNFIVTVKK